MIPYAGQLKSAEYEIYKHRSHHGKGTTYFCNDILCFDIEVTSSFIDENGDIILYEPGKSSEYWNELEPLALCYLWMFSFNDTVYYGRDIKDFIQVLKDLPERNKYIIYIHNAAYEFAFLDNILTWSKVFARTPHKPMKFISEEFPNIEFRCTYMLTRLSLDAWGKKVGYKKLTGTVDYNVMRTPLTKLDKDMLKYGEADVLVMYHGLLEYKKQYINMKDIPLTQTGTVRKVIKESLIEDPQYMKLVKRLVPKDAKEYNRLQQGIFAGGYTHANRLYSGQLIDSKLYGLIRHKDIVSSYPTIMVAYKFPMTPWAYIGDELPQESEFENKAYLIHLEFDEIRSTTFNTYIQAAKCRGRNILYDNGRVMKADYLEMWLTEYDWMTVKNTYDWKTLTVLSVYVSRKAYLNPTFTGYILDLYHNKTALKNVPGKEDIYAQSKQYINSMFGLMVTSPYMADIEYKQNTSEWKIGEITEKILNEHFDNLRYYRDKRYFLSYSWGCYVTSIARYRLWQLIRYCDQDLLYTDTDSIFYIGDYDFSWFDEDITQRLKTACETMDLDFGKTRPKDPSGQIQPLGILSDEPDCIEFKTLGAKKYVERRTDGKLHLTVSGINKGAVDCLNDDINNFSDGFIFDKDHPSVKKNILTYIDAMPEVIYPDGYISTYKRGINIRPNGYEIHITDEYQQIMEAGKFLLEDLPDELFNHIRGCVDCGEE